MGHGHVIPNPDGSKVRCGGRALCSVCALEHARLTLHAAKDAPVDPVALELRTRGLEGRVAALEGRLAGLEALLHR